MSDLDFGSSSRKLERERERRKAELKRKREKEEAARALAQREREKLEQISADRRAREAQEMEEMQQRELEEAKRTGGIKFNVTLSAYPMATDGDRITLPPSSLETLTANGALDSSSPMTFEIRAFDGQHFVATTHSGVVEFTAEEGTVGIPPKTALSLTRERGLSILNSLSFQIKYVKLPRFDKSFIQLQPRGHGFHRKGEDVVNIDIKSVLERELSRHTTVSKGDWIAIRHEQRTYELIVKDLQPANALTLINTDLEVDIMPSEAAQAEIQRQELIEARKLEAEREAELNHQARLKRMEELASSLETEPEPSNQSVTVLVRLPSGGQISRRFSRLSSVSCLFDFVESEVAAEFELDPDDFSLEMNYPKKSLSRQQDGEISLKDAGLTGKREALFLRTNHDDDDDSAMDFDIPSPAKLPDSPQTSAQSNEWSSAAHAHKTRLDRQLSEENRASQADPEGQAEEQLASSELVDVFHTLKEAGVESQRAATLAQRYGPQFRELASMGFIDYSTNATLLERYSGRMLRVVNALSERPQSEEPSPVPSPPLPIDPKTSFHSKFAEFVSNGMDPNQAAAMAMTAMMETSGVPKVPQPTMGSRWQKELDELAGMGFDDIPRNVELLERYQGRMVRVVNALAEGN